VTGVTSGSANITATSEGRSGSAPITVTNPLATYLAITTQPSSSATSGIPFAAQPVIQLRDASNNVMQQSGVAVTATIASGGGTLNGTPTVSTDASGVATFTDLAITATTSGARTLAFSTLGDTVATSSSIAVTTTTTATPSQTTGPFAHEPKTL